MDAAIPDALLVDEAQMADRAGKDHMAMLNMPIAT